MRKGCFSLALKWTSMSHKASFFLIWLQGTHRNRNWSTLSPGYYPSELGIQWFIVWLCICIWQHWPLVILKIGHVLIILQSFTKLAKHPIHICFCIISATLNQILQFNLKCNKGGNLESDLVQHEKAKYYTAVTEPNFISPLYSLEIEHLFIQEKKYID